MKNNEEFDRLARQKMNERQFAFDEAHWHQAQKMISGNRKNRGYLHLLWLLLPIAAIFIWMNSGKVNEKELMVGHQSVAVAPVSNESKQPTQDAIAESAKLDLPKSQEKILSDNVQKNSVEQTESKVEINNTRTPVLNSKNSRINNEPRASRSADKRNEKKKARDDQKQNVAIPFDIHSNTILSQSLGATIAGSSNDDDKSTNTNQYNNARDLAATSSVLSPDVPILYHENNKESSAAGSTAEVSIMARTTAEKMTSKVGRFSDDETVLLTAGVIPAPISRWWKLTAFGGITATDTRIGGLVPQPWMDNVQGSNTSLFGLEVMRQYRHFGWGTGLHYSTYGESFDVGPEYLTTSETNKYWFLTPVDTTIWIITDSVANGNGYTYIGYSEERTIQVLQSETETLTTTEQLRDARRIENTVSYFEIPVFADVHAGRGKWIVGLRGGPTLGKLVQRTGAMPNAEGTGYVDFGNTIFREFVPGYSLRAYVDYKIGLRWSVGLQAGRKGIFGNTLVNSPYTRNTSAWGGMVGVSYMFRSER